MKSAFMPYSSEEKYYHESFIKGRCTISLNMVKKLAKAVLAKRMGIKSNSIIYRNCNLNYNTKLEGHNVIYSNVNIVNSMIGYGSYIAADSTLKFTKIGKYCSIGPNVQVVAGRHPSRNFVSTHPSFFSTNKQAGFTYVDETIFKEVQYTVNDQKYYASIGNDVWIGANVVILDGVTIGDGVIVAAGAVVKGDLEPYYIYGGVPARKIGERFPEKEREYLLKLEWWNFEEKWIKDNAHLFSNIKLLIEKHPVQ